MKSNTIYKEGQEYVFNVKTKEEFLQLIGQLTIEYPNYPIEGHMSMYDVDRTIIEGIEISLASLWGYRDFITSFTIGSSEIKQTIFWVHLEK